MARVAIILPQKQMCAAAAPLIPEFKNISLTYLEYVNYNENYLAAVRARKIEEQGCDLFVARGVQAHLIKQATSTPVVEIQITTQELGGVILDLKQELGGVIPRIALICFRNMVGDTSHFGDLFSVDWRTYFVENSGQIESTTEQAKADGCLAVIGGNTVCEHARELGLPCRFLPFSQESLRNALAAASSVCYAIDQKKRNLSEMDTMLNYTFSGIMQVDCEGVIQRINRAGYAILDQLPGALLGKKAADILPELKGKLTEDALLYGEESYALVMNIHEKAVVVNIAPIRLEDKIRGAILTFQEGRQILDMDSELRSEVYQRGFIAKYSFESFISESRETQSLVRTAKRIAKYSVPVFLTGEAGSGKSIMAQCIHRDSLSHKNAFVSVDCSAWMQETLDGMLFGNYTTRKESSPCLAELAQNGTLYLSHVEHMMPETQYKLLELIRGRFLHNGASKSVAANVRVIVSTESGLKNIVEKGEFRQDLFYALNVLSLNIPPLRKRREDIEGWVDHYMNEWQEKYKRYPRLTEGARKYLREYDWPGNLNQISSTCERIILMMEKQSIDEVFLRRQIESVMPLTTPEGEQIVVQDPRAAEIMTLLSKYYGNRDRVASELGISKTTLWRHMKKYGIGTRYGKSSGMQKDD